RLALRHRRPFNFDVGVAPSFRVNVSRLATAAGTARVDVADIDAADESDLAIDDHQLAMVAMVCGKEMKPSFERADWIESQCADAGASQALKESIRGVNRTEIVEDDIHLHARLLLRDQHVGKFFADRIVVEGEGFEIDAVVGALDRSEHRAVGVGSVLEQRHLVADYQGAARDRLFEGEMAVQYVGIARSLFELADDSPVAVSGQGTVAPRELRRLPIQARRVDRLRGIGQRAASSETGDGDEHDYENSLESCPSPDPRFFFNTMCHAARSSGCDQHP